MNNILDSGKSIIFNRTMKRIINYYKREKGKKEIEELENKILEKDSNLDDSLKSIYKLYKKLDSLEKEGIEILIKNILTDNFELLSEKIYPIRISSEEEIKSPSLSKKLEGLINELKTLELNVKVKAEKVRRMHMEFGEAFYRAINIIEEIENFKNENNNNIVYERSLDSEFYDKVFNKKNPYNDFQKRISEYDKLDLFKIWYESLGFNRDFVKNALNRYKIFLYFTEKENIEIDDLYIFMSKLSVRTIKVLSKKNVTWDKRKKLLLLINNEPNVKSTEIEKLVNSDGEIFRKFTFSKALSLINKIDRVKNKMGKEDYKNMMKRLSEIEGVVNEYVKSEAGKINIITTDTFESMKENK